MSSRTIMDLHATLAIHRSMEVRREEYLDHMTFRRNQRPLFTEIFGPLIGLKDEWAQQGASPQDLDLSAFPFRRHMVGHIPVQTGWIGGHEPRILEESDEHILAIDRYGRRVQLIKRCATLPLPLDHPVATMDDWLRIKHHYVFDERRLEGDWRQAALAHHEAGRVVTVHIPGGFDEPRQLMGEEALCMAFYDQPEMIHDMLSTMAATCERVLDRVSATVQVDQLSVHEDLAGKSGSLIGPTQIASFIKPYYRRVWDMLASRGARLFDMDSDGDMNAVIDAFLDAGVNVLHPMECAANMDIVALRKKYGKRLAMVGGLDKHVLRRSPAEIDAELEYKIPPMVRTGGCVLGLDHRIPNGTPLAHYRHYIRKAWEILNREQATIAGGEQ